MSVFANKNTVSIPFTEYNFLALKDLVGKEFCPTGYTFAPSQYSTGVYVIVFDEKNHLAVAGNTIMTEDFLELEKDYGRDKLIEEMLAGEVIISVEAKVSKAGRTYYNIIYK